MKWLITGGCGFIGTGLVADLVTEGTHAVRVLDNLLVGGPDDLAAVTDFRETPGAAVVPMTERAQVELVVGDILDPDLALRAASGADVIVHLAANTGVAPSVEDPRQDCRTNVIGTLNLLEAARHQQTKRFVFASSGAPIGDAAPPIHEKLAPHPASPYGASKLAGEGYCSAYFRTFGVATVALRFGNVYGPRSSHKDSVVARFIRQAFAGEELEIHGDGTQTRDFIYIDDLVHAIRLAAVADKAGGEVFQIATSAETTVIELVDRLVSLLRPTVRQHIRVRNGAVRVGDVRRSFFNTAKAKELLGWSAKVTLEEGLRHSIVWFSSRGDRRQ